MMDTDKRAAVLVALPKHLRTIAHEVRKIGRGNPEQVAVAKDEIATMLTGLAALLEADQ